MHVSAGGKEGQGYVVRGGREAGRSGLMRPNGSGCTPQAVGWTHRSPTGLSKQTNRVGPTLGNPLARPPVLTITLWTITRVASEGEIEGLGVGLACPIRRHSVTPSRGRNEQTYHDAQDSGRLPVTGSRAGCALPCVLISPLPVLHDGQPHRKHPSALAAPTLHVHTRSHHLPHHNRSSEHKFKKILNTSVFPSIIPI